MCLLYVEPWQGKLPEAGTKPAMHSWLQSKASNSLQGSECLKAVAALKNVNEAEPEEIKGRCSLISASR